MPRQAASLRHAASPRVIRAALLLTLGVYALSFLPGVRGAGPAFDPWLDIGLGDGVIVLAGVSCLIRAGRDSPARTAWLLLGAGALVYVVGDLAYYGAYQARDDIPYPSWSDAAWLAMYPLVNAGLVLLVRAQFTRVRASLWLDGLTGGLGAAAVVGALVLRPVLELTGGKVAVVLTNLAYPIGDLALLTVLILVFNLHGWRPGRSWWLLAAAPAVLLVVDSVYLLQVSAGTYTDGTVLDVGWSVAFTALGLAGTLRPPEPRTVHEGRASLAVPATLSVASTGVLFAGAVQALPVIVCLLGLAAVLIASLRLFVALVETRRLVQARHEARTDELTGLPNRRLFLEEVDRRLAGADARLTVMIVDLDRFKQVNDSLGHRIGDMLLTIIGGRLSAQVATTGVVVARLGGDEFAVLLDGDDAVAAAAVGDQVRTVLAQPVELSGLVLGVDASVGVSLSPAHGTTWEALMSRADAAMYVAKRTRTGVELYLEIRDEGGMDRLAMLAELRVALQARELELHYQLVHELADSRVSSCEALIRWNHHTRGLLSPADFLPIAIEAGLSRSLTDEVLRMATEQAASWLELGTPMPIAVNLTEADLADSQLVARVASACARVALPAHLLRLEVTESIAAPIALGATAVLQALRARGHELLLDDFGTGFSSLSYLRDLPLDEVKLDRSFLLDLDDPAATAMVSATISLAHQIGLRIVAEGVESESTLNLLRDLGCDSVQGFLLHRPCPAGQVTALLGLDRVTTS